MNCASVSGFPPGGFLQATEDGERELIACVQEAAAGADRIADLFAGLGTFALAAGATDVHVTLRAFTGDPAEAPAVCAEIVRRFGDTLG